MPTQSSQPNSKNSSDRQTRDNAKSPTRRSRAREDIDESGARSNALAVVNLHLFSTRLADAAAWRRGELPPHFPFGLSLWLAAVFFIGLLSVQ
jgi:hypothetical protein